MHTGLPVVFAAGLFDSRERFSGTETNPRTVTDYELEIFVCDGGVSHVNGISYPIRKNAMLIAKPGDRRSSILHFSAQFVHFSVKDPALRQLADSVSGVYPPQEADYLQTLCHICDAALDMEPDSDLLAGALLTELLCRVKKARSAAQQISYNQEDSVVGMSIDYMKQNYMKTLSIEKLAQCCNVSASHLHKLFAQTVHTTPGNYLTRLRLTAAKNLLRTTGMSVSEVAEQCGFNSQAYFSDCFRKHCGISPKEFRRFSQYPEK